MRSRVLVLVAFLALLGGVQPAGASPLSDAEFTFSYAKTRGLDVGAPLDWTFQVEGVPAQSVLALKAALVEDGFVDVSSPEDDSANDEGIYGVWFSDRRVHTVASLASRIGRINELTGRYGGALEYQSVTEFGAAP
jgi:hypothetical protein